MQAIRQIQILVERYHQMIPRLVEGVYNYSPSFQGLRIQELIDEDKFSVFYGNLVEERIQSLLNSECSTLKEAFKIFHQDIVSASVLCLGLKEKLDLYEVSFEDKELVRLFRKSVLLALAGKLEKYWKYQTCWVYARFLQDELPPVPDWWNYREKPGFLLGGRFRRFQTLHLHGGTKRYEGLAYSLTQVKRVADDAPRDFITETLKKHRRALTCPRGRPEKAVPTSLVYDSIIATCNEVFPRRKSIKLPIRVPSLRSHVESDRGERGAVGWIVKEFRIQPCPSLLSMRESPGSDGVVMIYSRYDPEEIRCSWLEYHEGRGYDPSIKLHASPVALCEPFKVRVITKGESGAYWVAKGLQGKLWAYLKSHPTFRLVGEPCSEEIVDDFLLKCSPMDWFISGDYEQATDNIDPDLTDFTFCYLCQRLGMFPSPLFRAALTGHVLEYQEERVSWVYGEKISTLVDIEVDQINGQLMGSPLSFIILCVVNVALSRLALDSSLRVPLRDLPVLVNGDDIIMGMSLEQYQLWKGITTQGGLTYSIGKNYCSRRYLNINSEMYRISRICKTWDRHGMHFDVPFEEMLSTFCPFINLGLMKGKSRASRRTQLFGAGEFVSDLAGLACALVKGHTKEMADRLLSRFIFYNRSELDKLPPGMSWFLPRSSGGYGLPLTRDASISPSQLKVAAYVRTGQGALRIKHVEADPCLKFLIDEEDKLMSSLGSEYVEGGVGNSIGLMRVNWPCLNAEMKKDKQLKTVRCNFGRLRVSGLATPLHPMELINAMEEVSFGWSRSVTLDIPALKVRMN